MGTTFVLKRRQSFMLVLGMGMALALVAQIEGGLTLVNKLPHNFLYLDHPPGCCSPFSGFHPPPPGYGCAKCPFVYLAPNVIKTLDPIVGPYPLQFLRFFGKRGAYCVIRKNLQATNTMTIGPKEYGDGEGIEVEIVEIEKPMDFPMTFCMMLCSG